MGALAKEGERNVVQITTENDEGEEVTHTILSLKVGLNEQVRLVSSSKIHCINTEVDCSVVIKQTAFKWKLIIRGLCISHTKAIPFQAFGILKLAYIISPGWQFGLAGDLTTTWKISCASYIV